jgi:hypothetical protein
MTLQRELREPQGTSGLYHITSAIEIAAREAQLA